MSCFNNCYLPQPPRAWSRVQNSCSLITDTNNTVFNTLLGEKTAMLNKGNVLQYKALSSNLTKAQRYSKIAKGQWTNRNTTWATQSTRGYTNPNSTSLKRGGNVENIAIDPITGAIIGPTTAPPTCPKTVVPVNEGLPSNGGGGSTEEPEIPPPVEPKPGSDTFPAIIPETPVEPIVIQDGGNLICSVQENICTGETKRSISQQLCNPTTDSDVPGTIQDLCWNDGTPTWYPRQRYVMSNSANKWPVNATLVGAIQIIPPVITSIASNSNIVTLTWTQDQTCLPITNYNIYQNDILIQTVPGTIFSSEIIVSNISNTYLYYLIAETPTAKIVSNKSNVATISIIDPPSNLSYTTIGSGKIQLTWVGPIYSKIKVSYNNYNNSKALVCNNENLFFDIFGVPNCISYDNYNNSRSLINNNSNLFFDISGLTNCLNYTFYISSIDSFNNESTKVVIHDIISRWSDPPSDVTEADIILTSITGVNEGTATIQLSWTEPNSCVGIDGYNIYIDDILDGKVTYTDTIYTTTSLNIDTTYMFTITTRFTQLEIQCESDPSIQLSVTLPPIYSQLDETTTESYMDDENSIILTYLDNGQFNFYYDLSMQFTLVGGGGANGSADVKTAAGGGAQILNSSKPGWVVKSDNWDITIGAGQKAPSNQDDLGGDSLITSSMYNITNSKTVIIDNVTYSGYGGGFGASGSKTRAAGGVYTQNIYAKTIGTRGSNYSMGIYGAGGAGAGGSLTTIDEAGNIIVTLGNKGENGSSDKGGKGGDGFQGIDGHFYSGGGGGGSDVSTIVGFGGTGGGSNGATVELSSSDGGVNTGGGGGGGNNDNNPGNGGSGIVILKFKAP